MPSKIAVQFLLPTCNQRHLLVITLKSYFRQNESTSETITWPCFQSKQTTTTSATHQQEPSFRLPSQQQSMKRQQIIHTPIHSNQHPNNTNENLTALNRCYWVYLCEIWMILDAIIDAILMQRIPKNKSKYCKNFDFD